MAGKFIEDIVLENTRIIHRNFEGRAGDFNREGDRSFSAVIAPELVDGLRAEGWNVRELPPREGIEGSEPLFYIPVRVNFEGTRPAKVFIVGKDHLVPIDPKDAKTLDTAEIVKVDCMLHPSKWERNGKSGVKAYLKDIYVTIREDVLASKYEQMYAQEGMPEV